jgi:geranylgeranylglycerol-phosphate geranylgeranyltransferase
MTQRTTTVTAVEWAHRAWGVVCLLRPVNVVMVMVGVGLGGVLSGSVGALEGETGVRLLTAALSAALIAGAANSLNDALDLEIDRVNRPARPLPSGLVSGATARLVWGVGTVAGVALGASLSSTHLALALGAAGLLVVYNVSLKRVLLLGNVVVAFVISLALVYGGWTAGSLRPALVGAGFAFLTTLAREIVKDIEDVAGDAAAGARTLPLVYGVPVAARVTVGVLFATLLLTPLPFFLLHYRGLFLLLILAAAALLLYALWICLGPQPEARARQTSRVLKAVMVAGMVALTVGALVQLGD